MTTPITKEQLRLIIESADDVISAQAGTNEDVHPESDDMIRLWDYLNDVAAPPAVVKQLAEIALAAMDVEPIVYMNRFTGRAFELEEQPGEDKDPAVYMPLYAAPPSPVMHDSKQVDELTMWIKRLAHSLKYANQLSKLPSDAMEYLSRKGLISVGDILR